MNSYGMQPPPGYVYSGSKMFPSFAKTIQLEREAAHAHAELLAIREQFELEEKKRKTDAAYFEYVNNMLEDATRKFESWLKSYKCPLISIGVFKYEHLVYVSVRTKDWAEFITKFINKRGKASAEYGESCDSFYQHYFYVNIKCKPYYFVG